MKKLAEVEFAGSHVILEYEDTDPELLPFVSINTDEGSEWYTANELRKLAAKMDVWQDMNDPGGAA